MTTKLIELAAKRKLKKQRPRAKAKAPTGMSERGSRPWILRERRIGARTTARLSKPPTPTPNSCEASDVLRRLALHAAEEAVPDPLFGRDRGAAAGRVLQGHGGVMSTGNLCTLAFAVGMAIAVIQGFFA